MSFRIFAFLLALSPALFAQSQRRFLILLEGSPMGYRSESVWLQYQVESLESRLGFSLRKRVDLELIQSVAVDLTSSEKAKILLDSSIRSIIPLGRRAQLLRSIPPSRSNHFSQIEIIREPFTWGLQKIGLPEVQKQFPDYKGQGIRVGIIDTGIDPNHPDLKGKVQAFRDFVNPNNTRPLDDHGHGSHVAGTIAGGNSSGQWIGIAPSTQLLIAKGFNSRGNSTDEGLLLALQWMSDPDGNPQTSDSPSLISNSWNIDEGTTANKSPDAEPFCLAISKLRQRGILSVFAAGNDGPRASSILVPGACPDALTVGATDSNDNVTEFSSRGPVRWKTLVLMKPEISAPGQSINSAHPGGGYRTRSGTSMAAPHVSGALALILNQMLAVGDEPSSDRAAEKLLQGTKDLGAPGPDVHFGTGRLDLLKSLQR